MYPSDGMLDLLLDLASKSRSTTPSGSGVSFSSFEWVRKSRSPPGVTFPLEPETEFDKEKKKAAKKKAKPHSALMKMALKAGRVF